jgi:hypothetical protein
MPGFLVHAGIETKVICAHGGQATPMTPNPKVLINGQPSVLATAQYQITGCTMPPPPNGNGPCVTAQWIPATGTTRVTSFGQPLLVQSSQATCMPTGTPLQITFTQTRVSAI